jgi:hypothetical protein
VTSRWRLGSKTEGPNTGNARMVDITTLLKMYLKNTISVSMKLWWWMHNSWIKYTLKCTYTTFYETFQADHSAGYNSTDEDPDYNVAQAGSGREIIKHSW